MYKIDNKHEIQNPVVQESSRLIDQICKSKGLHLSENINLPKYSNFNEVSLPEMIELKYVQNQEGFSPVVEEYTNKLFRFCEINLWQYEKKLQAKALSAADKMIFHHVLIIFFIHSFLLSNDFRFLNTALKLDNLNKIGFFSRSILSLSNKAILQLAANNSAFLTKTTAI